MRVTIDCDRSDRARLSIGAEGQVLGNSAASARASSAKAEEALD